MLCRCVARQSPLNCPPPSTALCPRRAPLTLMLVGTGTSPPVLWVKSFPASHAWKKRRLLILVWRERHMKVRGNKLWKHLLLCLVFFFCTAASGAWRKPGRCEPVCGVWCLCSVSHCVTYRDWVGRSENSKLLLWQLIICKLRGGGPCARACTRLRCGAVRALLENISNQPLMQLTRGNMQRVQELLIRIRTLFHFINCVSKHVNHYVMAHSSVGFLPFGHFLNRFSQKVNVLKKPTPQRCAVLLWGDTEIKKKTAGKQTVFDNWSPELMTWWGTIKIPYAGSIRPERTPSKLLLIWINQKIISVIILISCAAVKGLFYVHAMPLQLQVCVVHGTET